MEPEVQSKGGEVKTIYFHKNLQIKIHLVLTKWQQQKGHKITIFKYFATQLFIKREVILLNVKNHYKL